MSIMTQTAAQYQRHLDKAQSMGGAKLVTEISPNKYSVLASNHADFYQVQVLGSGQVWTCDCPAGRNERCCYHLASVYLYRVGVAMKAAATVVPIAEPLPEFLLDESNRVLRPADGRYEVVGILIEGTPAHSAGCELFGPGVPNCPRCN